MMDNLLNMRKSSITEAEAMLSNDGLIAYLNQSESDKIRHAFEHCTASIL
jgi:hypothetical protein